MAEAVTASLIVGGILGGTQMYTSYSAARAKNKAISASMKSQAEAARIQQQQLADRAGLEKLKNINRAQQIIGRLRVAAGEAGVGIGGSYEALINQALYDSSLNEKIIERNYSMQARLVRSGAAANLASLESSVTNPMLGALISGIQTGMQTVNTGLAIAGTGSNIRDLNRTS